MLIEKAYTYLLEQEPFYGEFACLIPRRIVSDPNLTAMVSFSEIKGFEITLGAEWTATLPFNEVAGLLQHELNHVLMGHLTSVDVFTTAHNVAADTEINQLNTLPLPPGGITLEGFRESIAPHAEAKRDMEYYYSLIPAKDGLAAQGFDAHRGESSPLGKEMVRELAKKASEQAEARAPGSTPGFVVELIKSVGPQLNWAALLRKFIGRASRQAIEPTRSRRNRRQRSGDPLKEGVRRKLEVSLSIGVDVSGSVSSEELSRIKAQLDGLSDRTEMTLYQFDCEVKGSGPYKKRANWEIVGRGGTSFVSFFNAVKENKDTPSALIVFTDGGDDVYPSTPPPMPVLWCITTNCKFRPPFGEVIYLDSNK